MIRWSSYLGEGADWDESLTSSLSSFPPHFLPSSRHLGTSPLNSKLQTFLIPRPFLQRTAPSTPRSGGHPEPLLQTTPTTAGIEAYFNSLGDDWVSTERARADSDQPAQPVDDAVGDGGGGDRMADDQDVDEDDDDADELAEDESELTDVGGDEPQSRARLSRHCHVVAHSPG